MRTVDLLNKIILYWQAHRLVKDFQSPSVAHACWTGTIVLPLYIKASPAAPIRSLWTSGSLYSRRPRWVLYDRFVDLGLTPYRISGVILLVSVCMIYLRATYTYTVKCGCWALSMKCLIPASGASVHLSTSSALRIPITNTYQIIDTSGKTTGAEINGRTRSRREKDSHILQVTS